MDFTFTEEQSGAVSVAADVFSAASTFVPGVARPSGTTWFDHQTWQRAADAGLVGLALATTHGGAGMGVLETCAVLEQQGRYLARIPGVWTVAVGAPAIDRFGSEALRAALLPGVIRGEIVLTVALSDTDVGCTEVADTRIADLTDGFVLNGFKRSVPLGGMADWIVVPARHHDGTLRVAAVPGQARGVSVRSEDTISGAPEARVEFDDVFVEPSWLLGEKACAGGAEVLDWLIACTTVSLCAVQSGVAAKVLEMTAAYTAERNVFGRPLATFQTVLARAADGHLALERMRWSMWLAAWLMAEGEDASTAADVAKYWAAEGAEAMSLLSHQLHGGLGVDVSYPLHEYTLWAKHYELTLGGAHAHLARIGKALADSPALARGAGCRD